MSKPPETRPERPEPTSRVLSLSSDTRPMVSSWFLMAEDRELGSKMPGSERKAAAWRKTEIP